MPQAEKPPQPKSPGFDDDRAPHFCRAVLVLVAGGSLLVELAYAVGPFASTVPVEPVVRILGHGFPWLIFTTAMVGLACSWRPPE